MDTATFPLTTARSILLLSLHILDLRTLQRYDIFAMPVVDSDGVLVGMSLPFLLSKFNLDPATASAPLITSIADICGVLIYFSIATWYLGIG